ncbi:MAG: alpha/beta hydrolase, partial [Ilumatobacteraceae bacterium]
MTQPTIVLVHGAWADGSSWNPVSTDLQRQGFTVLTPPNLLHGVAGDAAYISSFLAQRTSGPVVLVGHSYGGVVITNAGASGGDVKALVYVDAHIPDVGETVFTILGGSGSALDVPDPTAVL